jgi:uncharacterized protein (TIGR02271 family)
MVTDGTGRRGRIVAHSRSDAGDELIEVALADEQRAVIPRAMLAEDGQSGGYRLDDEFETFLRTGVDDTGKEVEDAVHIPVIEEELTIGKRAVETGRVRASVVVNERDELVDVPLTTERVEVERIPINQIVDEPQEPFYEGDTLVVPVVEERLVVQKQLVLTEEVRIRRVAETRDHQERITLRSQDVEIERA